MTPKFKIGDLLKDRHGMFSIEPILLLAYHTGTDQCPHCLIKGDTCTNVAFFDVLVGAQFDEVRADYIFGYCEKLV